MIEIVEASNAQAVSDKTVTVITSPSLALEADVELLEVIVTASPGSVAFTSMLVVSEAPLVAKAVSASLLYKSFILPPLRSNELVEAMSMPPEISPS